MRFLRRAAAAAVAIAALTPAAASAAPALNGEYTPTGQPTYITAGPDGNVWFSIATGDKEIGRIAPDGTITEYDTPDNKKISGLTAGPDVAGGPKNRIWAAFEGGVIKWDPAAGTGTKHDIATLTSPRNMTVDPEGNLWAVASDRLVKIKPDGTKIKDVLEGQVGGRQIDVGSDGRIWVADFGNSAIVAVERNEPHNKQSFPTSAAPQGLAAGPAGQLGIALPNNQMGRITTAGVITETTDNGADAFGTTYGADGAYWFAQFATNTLGRLTPDGQYARAITLPAASGPRHITAGPGNTLWATGETSGKIYRVTGVEPPATTPPPPPPPPPGDTKAPVLSGGKVNVAKRRFTGTLDEAASLRLRIDQKTKGRRVNRKCRSLKRGQVAKRKCTLWKKRRTIQAQGVAGKNTVPLGRKLAKGSYRLVVTAKDAAGNTSKTTIAFKVKAAKKKRR